MRLDINAVHKGLNINLDPRVNYEQAESAAKKELPSDKNHPTSKLFAQDNLQKEWKSVAGANVDRT